MAIAPPSDTCPGETTSGIAYEPAASKPADLGDKHDFEKAYDEGFFDRMGYKVEPSLMAKQWAALSA